MILKNKTYICQNKGALSKNGIFGTMKRFYGQTDTAANEDEPCSRRN